MTDMKWQDPPPHGNAQPRSTRWAEAAAALRGRPGEWAIVAEATASSLLTDIKTGRKVAFRPAGSFEAVSRKRDDGDKFDIYARYVGGA